MEPIVNLGVAILVLLIALSMALSYMSGPLAVLKRSGALRAGRRVGRLLWRGLASLSRLCLRRRRPRIRRDHTRAPTVYFR